jgi:hypothetical protein
LEGFFSYFIYFVNLTVEHFVTAEVGGVLEEVDLEILRGIEIIQLIIDTNAYLGSSQHTRLLTREVLNYVEEVILHI